MTGVLITSDHTVYELPELLSWSLTYTGAVPCDCFTVTCPYTAEMADSLHLAAGFTAFRDGEVLLRGIVDEYQIVQSAVGRTVTVEGRGYAARLLDNESRPMIYQTAVLSEIVRNHVTPYGITCKTLTELRATSEYTVASGSSQWSALEKFCRTYGGFTPRFDREGKLIAAAESGGNAVIIDDFTPVLSLSKRENHYGVLSEVLVIDKTRNTSYSVKNQEFMQRGGQCRRVLYTPGQSTWAAMRYTGEYQIRQSRAEQLSLTITLPEYQVVEPGDTVTVNRNDCGLRGTYRAAEVHYAMTDQGELTTLTLKEKV